MNYLNEQQTQININAYFIISRVPHNNFKVILLKFQSSSIKMV